MSRLYAPHVEADLLLAPVIITLPDICPNEPEAISALAAAGAGIIHVRKPYVEEDKLNGFIEQIPVNISSHITIHYRSDLAKRYGLGGIHDRLPELKRRTDKLRKSCSCHSWEEVYEAYGYADYVFLSPIFDSVSKLEYKAAFGTEYLKDKLYSSEPRPEVVALGGITEQNIVAAREMGFEGAAVLGSLWAVGNGIIDIDITVDRFMSLKEKWRKIK
ncbi:MAG: thiamine phosphate synthase [Rikenellaceae bacterium]|nr:thiamine phosphate synthase [Rikenellaceae bacterium]